MSSKIIELIGEKIPCTYKWDFIHGGQEDGILSLSQVELLPTLVNEKKILDKINLLTLTHSYTSTYSVHTLSVLLWFFFKTTKAGDAVVSIPL